MFMQLLADTHKLVDQTLHEAIERAQINARELRQRVLSHMNQTELASFQELRDIMETVQQDLCVTVGNELRGQLVDPVQILDKALEDLRSGRIPEFSGVKIEDFYERQLPDDTFIIIDSALFQRIVANLMSNLRHAVDENTRSIRVKIVLKLTDDSLGPQVSLQVKSLTHGASGRPSGTMTAELLQSAEAYGVEHFVPDECRTLEGEPWDETWSFWRL
jgi:signal transduction histidine kinase